MLDKMQTVRIVSFEVFPDLFHWIEFWCIARKPFDLESRIVPEDLINERTFVDLAVIPEQNDVSVQVIQKASEELRDMWGFEVFLLEAHIKPHMLPDRRD